MLVLGNLTKMSGKVYITLPFKNVRFSNNNYYYDFQ